MSKGIRRFLIGLCCALTVFAGVMLVAYNRPEGDAMAKSCEVTLAKPLENQYILGTTLDIPSGQLSYDGDLVAADRHKIVTPSGLAYGKTQLVLDEAGVYTVYYYKSVESTLLTGKKTFMVSDTAYSVGADSTIKYLENGKDASDVVDTYVNDRVANATGLKISLASGDEFRCNVPLDLNGVTKQNAILSFLALPEKAGNQEVNEVYVKLTDAYDENNYVIIKNTFAAQLYTGNTDSKKRTYQGASANGETFKGIQVVGSGGFEYDGENYVIYTGSKGFYSAASLAAAYGYGKNPFTFAMDYAEKKVYGSDKYNRFGGNTIIDLDDERFFDNLWSGFTTGECYLSVYAKGYSSARFNFIITDLYEQDLTATDIVAPNEPIIKVDSQENAYAIVGESFKLFPAKSYDIFSGTNDCPVQVLYNGTIDVPVINGAFTPRRTGKYTLRYYAEDKNGNASETKVFVQAYGESQMTLNFGGKSTPMQTGVEILVAEPTIAGASGKYSLSVTANKVGDANVSYELKKADGGYSFTPMYSGEYELVYEVKDLATTKTFTENIDVSAGTYILTEAPDIPEYFIKGARYYIEPVKCYVLGSGAPVEQAAEIYYVMDGGEQKLIGSEKVEITASATVSIIYEYDGSVISAYDIPVVDVGYDETFISIHEYFNSKDGSITADAVNTSYEHTNFIVNDADANMQFIKKIPVSNFEISFTVTECSFDGISFTWRNGDEKLTLDWIKNGDKNSKLIINGTHEVSLTFGYQSGDTCYVRYNNTVKVFTIVAGNKTTNYSIPEASFGGFTDKEAYLEIDVTGNLAQSNIRVFSLNGQNIPSSAFIDPVAPEVSYSFVDGIHKIGNKVVLDDVRAMDLLSVNSTCTLTVRDKDGNVVVDDNKVRLENVDGNGKYEFTLSEYGTYTLDINVSDDFNNGETKSFEFDVRDDVAPVIKMNTDTVYTKVGNAISVKSYSISDNIDKGASITKGVIVIRPDGVSFDYAGSFKATSKGIYTITVYAFDSTGNFTQATYSVVVR